MEHSTERKVCLRRLGGNPGLLDEAREDRALEKGEWFMAVRAKVGTMSCPVKEKNCR